MLNPKCCKNCNHGVVISLKCYQDHLPTKLLFLYLAGLGITQRNVFLMSRLPAVDVKYETLNGIQTIVCLDLRRMCCHVNCLLLDLPLLPAINSVLYHPRCLTSFGIKIIHK